MVEVLGEKKMALEQKVTELEEAVADLEALQVGIPKYFYECLYIYIYYIFIIVYNKIKITK